MKHSNLAIFVPHVGCPNQCSFCDQRVISGKNIAPTPQYVAELCQRSLAEMGERAKNCEVAFFGGSFTAIDHEYMVSLLQAACTYVGSSGFLGIRVSTRPDAITEEILLTLKKYKVTSIELGAQSMDDEVLHLNHRGHTAWDIINAANLIKLHGFSLGLQMMVGLYGDTSQKSLSTAKKIISLAPDTVRIYPTIVIKNTLLAELYQKGEYFPLNLNEGVALTTQLMELFLKEQIAIIRVGLHPSEQLEQDMLAGPYHQAFRELCEGELMLKVVLKQLEGMAPCKINIRVNPKDISRMTGQKRKNIAKLQELGYCAVVKADENCQSLVPIVTAQ